MKDRKIGLKTVGAGLAIASIGAASAAVLTNSANEDSSPITHESLFQESSYSAGFFTLVVIPSDNNR